MVTKPIPGGKLLLLTTDRRRAMLTVLDQLCTVDRCWFFGEDSCCHSMVPSVRLFFLTRLFCSNPFPRIHPTPVI